MLISPEHARSIYDEIINRVKRINGKIVIFVGFDIDSLCSLRILVSLLRSDNVRYEIIPVMNYNGLDAKLEEMHKVYESSHLNRDIKAIVMINCGGTRDMTEKWFCKDEYSIVCLLIDVHRPMHHNNLNTEKQVLVINDNYYEEENCPRDEDLNELQNGIDIDDDEEVEANSQNEEFNINEVNLKGNNNDEDNNNNNDDDDDGGEENENDEKDENGENLIKTNKRRKIQKKKNNLDTIDEESQNDENNDDNQDEVDRLVESVRAKKTTKSALEDEKKLKRKIRYKKLYKLKSYYSGNYFGNPAAYVLYKLAFELHREDTQTLWYLIIAMTEHYLQSHISQSMYDDLYKECHSEVLRLNQSRNFSTSTSSNAFVKKMKKEENDDEENKQDNIADKEKEKDKYDFSDVRVKSTNRDAKSIIVDPDYRLILYRHWNLFDSFVNSNYTLAHLVTWKEPGKEEIKKLLTLIGVPLEEAKQKYTYMKNEYKELFREKIIEVSSKFDLKDFIFYSFVYQLDQKTQLSASDFVYCLSSLLEYPFSIKNLEGNENGTEEYTDYTEKARDTTDKSKQGRNNNNDNDDDDDDNNSRSYINDERQMRMNYKYDTFWACYDFLSFKSVNMVKTVIGLAIKFQTTLITNGTKIIDKKSIQGSKSFRYAIINADIEEQKYFHNAIALEKLALFTMDTYHKTRLMKTHIAKPFVLAILNNTNKTYLVAGVLGNARAFEDEKNLFAMRFRICANKIGASLMLDSFDDCIIEIAKDDFLAFLEEICNE